MARKDPDLAVYLHDQTDFFETTLPGRDAPLHNPGGAAALGDLGVDTPLVSELVTT